MPCTPEYRIRLPAITSHPEARRVSFFVLFGGICALVNLAIVSALTIFAGWSYLPAVLIATELSVLLGFTLNDRITFVALARQAGGWLQRCARFHLGAAAGQILTIVLGLFLIHLLELKPILAQAISLAVVTVFNFVIQRFVTYAARSREPQNPLSLSQAEYDAASDPLAAMNPSTPRVTEPVSMLSWHANIQRRGLDHVFLNET